MKKYIWLSFAFFPQFILAQDFPNSARRNAEDLISIFSEGNFSYFLKEAHLYSKNHPSSSFSNEISWMEGHALYSLGQIDKAKEIFFTLTNTTVDNSVRHRALFDLANIYAEERNTTLAQDILERIQADPTPSPINEAAASRAILLQFGKLNPEGFKKKLSIFSQNYPNSPALSELYYFAALTELNKGNIKEAESYSQGIKNKKGDTVQRLLAEIALQKKDYPKALSQFQPLSEKEGVFQDEALYKSGLISKLIGDFTDSERYLSLLVEYFPNSLYRERARAELALIHILLKKYHNALVYYRYESGFSGDRKAQALLKITEIYFVKEDSRSTLRAAKRVQKDFPYSAYANEALYWTGRTYLNDKQFTKSIDIFNTYLIREPLSQKKDEIRVFLGQANTGLNDQAAARRYFQAVLREAQDETVLQNARLGLGRSYTLDEQPTRALEYYDAVWMEKPKSILAEQGLYFSGATRYNLRQNKEAAKNIQNLLAAYPNTRFKNDAVITLAKLNFKNEDFSNILSLDGASIQDKESLSELKELQARSEFRLGNYENALIGFQEAQKLTKKKDRQTELFLAEAGSLRNLGRRREALRLYEKYLDEISIKDNKKNIEEIIWSEITLTYIETGDLDKASQSASSFAQLFPKNSFLADLYFKLGDEHYIQKKYQKAAEFYQKARLNTNKKDVIAEAALREGWSLNGDNRFDEADDAFQIFLRQNPSHSAIGEVLGKQAEYKDMKGDIAGALTLREEIIQRFPDNPEAAKARVFVAGMLTLDENASVFEKAIQQTKDQSLQATILNRLALKYENEANTNKLTETLRRLHETKDTTYGAQAAVKLGNILLKEEDPREAIGIFVNVISTYPETLTEQALLGIVESYLALDDKKNALRFSDRLNSQYTNTPQAKKAKQLTKNIKP